MTNISGLPPSLIKKQGLAAWVRDYIAIITTHLNLYQTHKTRHCMSLTCHECMCTTKFSRLPDVTSKSNRKTLVATTFCIASSG